MNPAANTPIGIFDSGMGGLSVLRQVAGLLPAEATIYVADRAHVPYGSRQEGQILAFSEAIGSRLLEAGCKAVAGNLEMSNAEYTFKDPEPTLDAYVVNVYGDVYAPNTGKTLDSTWALDGSTGSWLVSGYSYVEK